MKCPVCSCANFYIKDPEDEYETYEFELKDGQPWPNTGGKFHAVHEEHLLSTVEELTKIGVEIVGIGMATDCVRKFYRDYIVVNDMFNLPQVVVAKLDGILKKGKMRYT